MKILPPPKKKSNMFFKKNMPMPELHTAPALSRLCVIFQFKVQVGSNLNDLGQIFNFLSNKNSN